MVYDLAFQPFSPVNIINEIAARTGTFKGGKQLTSIILADVEGGSIHFQGDEDKFMCHVESVQDQQVHFENEAVLNKLK